MSKVKNSYESPIISLLFLLFPTLLVIFGIVFFPHQPSKTIVWLPALLFGSLFLLLVGAFLNKKKIASLLKIVGWLSFAFYWATRINTLYYGEYGDFVNAFICLAGVFVLSYIAYHEWLSIKRNEEIQCLSWMAGASALAGIIYFGVELTALEMWLREVVASQSGWILNVVAGGTTVKGIFIDYGKTGVAIIFACTGVQSMVIFIGMMLPLKKVQVSKRIVGLLITVVPVYFLNLLRNALVVYLTGSGITDFNTAHNVIAKVGALVALVVLLFIVIKFVPEVFDEIMAITELPKRNGPIEKTLKKYIWRKN